MREMHDRVRSKCDEVDTMQNKVLCFKHEHRLMKGELEQKKEEINELKDF